MDNVGEQPEARPIKQFITDDQLTWGYKHPMDICLPSCAEQPQSLLAHTYFSPLPSPPTAEQFEVSTGHVSYGTLHTQAPSATGTVDFTMAFNPGTRQSHWSGMNSNLTHETPTHASVSPLQNEYQTPYTLLSGYQWSRDYETRPVSPILPGIPSIPQPLSPTLTHSSNVRQYDAWTQHVLDGSMDTRTSSPDGDTGLSTFGFLRALADYDYDCIPDARADPQSSIALTTRDPMPSIQSATFPYNEPRYGSHRQPRMFECQWLTNGALCETRVMADRRSVVGHLQYFHGVKPGEEKARKTCLWEQCGTTLNKESLARHILTVHLKERVHCAECGVWFAREDSLKRHLKGGQHKVPLDMSAARQASRNYVGFR